LVVTLLAAVMVAITSQAPAARAWAPADRATIRPGVQISSPSGQCTANFVFTYANRVFLGQAAHCTGTGGQTDTNGCETGSLPLGTPVDIQGASHKGWLHYSSWVTMRQIGEPDQDACAYNDFALIEVHWTDVGKVNPSIPFWGGPRGKNHTGIPGGNEVYGYGNSGLRLGLEALSPKIGTSVGTFANGWSHQVYTVTPGIPGDSGSALLDSQGRAAGVAATLSPLGSNNFTDLNHALFYAASRAGVYVQLALGTTRFKDAF
jgi:hypothetical protein